MRKNCGQPSIVQFQHRKDEIAVSNLNSCRIDNGLREVKWNCGDHRRRLLVCRGDFVESGCLHNGELAFWAEWEARTKARKLTPISDVLCAKRIHYPLPVIKSSGNLSKFDCAVGKRTSGCLVGRQNTDPCVFGCSFKYSNCKQRAAGELKRLAPGSLIVFGSIHDNQYMVDTVFVTSDIPFLYTASKNGIVAIKCSEEYRELTLERLVSSPPVNYAFYRGVKFESGMRTPYSFTPAYKFTAGSQSAEANLVNCRKRCFLDMNKLNNVAMKHGVAGAFDIKRTRPTTVTNANSECVKAVWDEIVDQVTVKQEFVLGVNFGWPKQ